VKRPKENVHTLLKGVDAREKVRMWMVGWSGMPAKAAPLTEMGEGQIVEMLISELKVNFGVKVSSKIILDREGEEVVVATTIYVMLGGSNCGGVERHTGGHGEGGDKGYKGRLEAD
jgi:hypothetical protein